MSASHRPNNGWGPGREGPWPVCWLEPVPPPGLLPHRGRFRRLRCGHWIHVVAGGDALEQLWIIPLGWSLCEDGLVRRRYISLSEQAARRERLAAALVAS